VCGLHRLYAGRWLSGIVWLLTGGLCFVGQFIDLFFIPRMIEDHNAGKDVW
jgi:TM2 domain-containing membrane protein YozV